MPPSLRAALTVATAATLSAASPAHADRSSTHPTHNAQTELAAQQRRGAEISNARSDTRNAAHRTEKAILPNRQQFPVTPPEPSPRSKSQVAQRADSDSGARVSASDAHVPAHSQARGRSWTSSPSQNEQDNPHNYEGSPEEGLVALKAAVMRDLANRIPDIFKKVKPQDVEASVQRILSAHRLEQPNDVQFLPEWATPLAGQVESARSIERYSLERMIETTIRRAIKFGEKQRTIERRAARKHPIATLTHDRFVQMWGNIPVINDPMAEATAAMRATPADPNPAATKKYYQNLIPYTDPDHGWTPEAIKELENQALLDQEARDMQTWPELYAASAPEAVSGSVQVQATAALSPSNGNGVGSKTNGEEVKFPLAAASTSSVSTPAV